MDREKIKQKVIEIVDYQFSGVTNLLPEAYQDSLRIIGEKVAALVEAELKEVS